MSPRSDPGDVQAIRWRDGRLFLLDQRRLPEEEVELELHDAAQAAAAIKDLVVRGAPAIGITAAYAAVLSARQHGQDRASIEADLDRLVAARPTAVNLAWAVASMRRLVLEGADSPALEREAIALHSADGAANRAMGRHGAALIEGPASVLTHCNAGALATGGYGTALGVIRQAFDEGRIQQVYAGETRPWLQGARLTAWELERSGIPVALVLEGAVASLFAAGRAQWLIVGADRIAANGDVANKIGTYSAALAARHHGARVMVAAPRSTIDLATPEGAAIPIEERSADEVLSVAGQRVAAAGVSAWNPVFDITPASLIDVIVTEAGIAVPPFEEGLARLMAD